MNTIIEKIRAEVERLKAEHQTPTFRGDEYEEGGVNGYQLALDKVLAKLSNLEKEEKPKFKVGDEVIISNEQKGIIIRISDGKARVEMGDTMQIVPLSDLKKSNSKDFPTTDEEMKQFLATHPKVEAPDRYKTPDWMFEKSEKPSEGFDGEFSKFSNDVDAEHPFPICVDEFKDFARHFYELGRQNKEQDNNKLGEIARHILAIKDHLVDMRLDDGEIELLKELGFPERKEQVQPVCDGLEEEINRLSKNEYFDFTDWKAIARHFAKWGAKHYLKLELLAKFAEMTGSIDTMPKNTLPPSKECEKGLREPLVSDNREEAAQKFADMEYMVGDVDRSALYKGFWHGSKWQAEQDQKTIELAEDHAYLAGAVNEREKMMKEAVEGRVEHINGFATLENVVLHPRDYKHGQKVKLIIIKED